MADELPPTLPASPAFPKLTPSNHTVTSERSRRYNCIAWAAGDDTRPWWPVVVRDGHGDDAHWPDRAPLEETVEAFVAAFATLGYTPPPDAAVEPGFEKVASYALDGVPTHAARQLPDGRWSSKLGRGYDVTHGLTALDGPVYGAAVLFLRRPAG